MGTIRLVDDVKLNVKNHKIKVVRSFVLMNVDIKNISIGVCMRQTT
jgi:hypothetical protein